MTFYTRFELQLSSIQTQTRTGRDPFSNLFNKSDRCPVGNQKTGTRTRRRDNQPPSYSAASWPQIRSNYTSQVFISVSNDIQQVFVCAFNPTKYNILATG